MTLHIEQRIIYLEEALAEIRTKLFREEKTDQDEITALRAKIKKYHETFEKHILDTAIFESRIQEYTAEVKRLREANGILADDGNKIEALLHQVFKTMQPNIPFSLHQDISDYLNKEGTR